MTEPATQTTHIHENHHIRHHWRYVYKHRRQRRLARDKREILLGQAISLVGALSAGIALELNKEQLLAVVGVFLMLPGIFELGGAVAGAFGAKINHFHEEHPRLVRRKFIPLLLYSLLLASAASFVLGSVGGLVSAALFAGQFSLLVQITVLSVFFSSVVGLPLVGLFTVLAIRRGLDADNVIGPIETSLFDVLSIVTTVIAIGIVL